MNERQEVIGIVGLGYVGMPLAAALAETYPVIGFDISARRIAELKSGKDHTQEVTAEELAHPNLRFTDQVEELGEATFIIVAVPTPVTESLQPDVEPLRSSSELVGRVLKKGMLVAYESTVYPGLTEEFCLPILEAKSGLKLGDFDLAYSPERVNPGDKHHTVRTVVKIVSGHDAAACERAAAVYRKATRAGVHLAPNIKTAEAAKVIENVQRDLNIALMNELSKIFHLVGINTNDVLAAAGTKWNFHKYHPGLVGGHCIGVDPYYLTHRAIALGYHPEVILAGRRINDSMGGYVGEQVIRELNMADRLPRHARILVLGLTFKENVPDFRNTRAIDVVRYLEKFNADVMVCEPMVDSTHLEKRFKVKTLDIREAQNLDAVILINGHDAFRDIKLEALKKKMRTPILVDIKNFFDRDEATRLGFRYTSL
ncbi:MAG TPA: nucleotide sugar dehydrogenase [Kiritimatiellia bacterium]|nr:nucleotide sugar dehydrogenase [Kiritimatiellia bacterium]HMO98875.1 nucleotide sugar dehydrogenase [Kiritimatiellia bacterium]HMP97266.1 nucleotide sugar dehydrogenase [Kiritimatiellia bacterium]